MRTIDIGTTKKIVLVEERSIDTSQVNINSVTDNGTFVTAEIDFGTSDSHRTITVIPEGDPLLQTQWTDEDINAKILSLI